MTHVSNCAKCGEPLYRDDAHCPRCGAPRSKIVLGREHMRGATRALAAMSAASGGEVLVCPSCGTPRVAEDAFCTVCGYEAGQGETTTMDASVLAAERPDLSPSEAPELPESGGSGSSVPEESVPRDSGEGSPAMSPGPESTEAETTETPGDAESTGLVSPEPSPPLPHDVITPQTPAPPPSPAPEAHPAAEDAGPPAFDDSTNGWDEVRLQLERATEGEFEIVRELGRGGMAAVYLARDLALGRNVAIKVMAPGLLMGTGMVQRFRQEAVTIANLHHPNIITIHTVRQAGTLHFFVMQLVEGSSLESVLARDEPLPVALAQAILYQVGTGLSHAHAHGVIHRDIKPGNVLLDKEGNAILTDFGIAKVTTASNLTQTGSTIGTPAYMSPEQCMASELTNASDQYSLGIVAYEMLVGRAPFSGSPFEIMQSHTQTAPPGIRDQRPDCPPELEGAILRMLAKDPAERFPSIAEAIEAIGGYVPGPRDPLRRELARLTMPDAPDRTAGREPLTPVPGAATPPPATGRRVPRPLLVAGLLGLGAVATVVALSTRSPSPAEPEPGVQEPAAVTGISFPRSTESVLVGATIRIRAGVEGAGGELLTDEEVTWASDDPTVAEVEGFGQEVAVTGRTPGTTTVRASAGGISERVLVEVSAPAVGELTVSSPRRELAPGERVTLSAVLTDAAGERVDDPDVVWSSSDPRVLEVGPATGVAMAQALGRAQVTAASGEDQGTMTLRVVGRVEEITLDPPSGTLQAGETAVVRAGVTAVPAGYLGEEGISWTSSNPSVANVSLAAGDSVVLTLLREGETVLSAQIDGIREVVRLRVSAAPRPVTLTLSAEAAAFEATEGGEDPPAQTVSVTVTGDADPRLGSVQYRGSERDWLNVGLGARTGETTALTLRPVVGALSEGAYRATVPITAGEETRSLQVDITVAPAPGSGPVEPNEAAEREIGSLLAEYAAAINRKDATRVQELFPSLPQQAMDDLLGLRDTDTYLLQLVPGSLRRGSEERTLEGDVMSSVLGAGNRGEAVRMIYTFGRGEEGWYLVSLRPGGDSPP